MSAPADVATAAPDAFRRFLDSLRQELRLGPADYIRAEQVRLVLASRGVRSDAPEAVRWLAPVLSSSAAEQQLVHQRFLAMFGAPQAQPAAASGPDPAREHRAERLRRISWRQAALKLAGVMVAGVLLGLAASHLPKPTPATQLAAAAETATAPPPPPTLDLVQALNRPLAFVPLLVAAAILYVRRRRRMALSRSYAPGGRRETVSLATAAPVLFGEPLLGRSIGALRRHRAAPGGRLNVARSLRATLRGAGQPALRFGDRPQTPEYVLLVDVESPRDHMRLVADQLIPPLASEHVVISRYDFYGDPRRVLPVLCDAADRRALDFQDLVARHPDARVLILAEAAIFFDEGGRLPRWAPEFLAWRTPVLLTPRRARDWGWAERALEDLGCLVVPATSAGVAGYAERLTSAGDAPLARWAPSSNHRLDLPQRLELNRDALLSEAPPPLLVQRELLADLAAWLGPDGYGLLQALAVFPRLEPELTQHLMAEAWAWEAPAGARERTFLSLARLPWLRAGRLPDWLRRALIGGMRDQALTHALGAVQRWLQPVGEQAGAATLEIARRGLLDWIASDPEAHLDDRIFIGALKGRRPAELAVEAPPGLRDWAQRRLGSPDLPLVAAAALAAVLAGVFQDRLQGLIAAAVGAAGLHELAGRLLADPWFTLQLAVLLPGWAWGATLLLDLARLRAGFSWRDAPRAAGRWAAASPWAALPLLAALDLHVRLPIGSSASVLDLSILIPGAGVVMARRYGARALAPLAGLALLSLALVSVQDSGGWGGDAGRWAAAVLLARLGADEDLRRRVFEADRLPAHGLALVFIVLGVTVRGPTIHLPSGVLVLAWGPQMLQATAVLLLGISATPPWPTLACINFPVPLLGAVLAKDVPPVWLSAVDPATGVTLTSVFLCGRALRWGLLRATEPIDFAAPRNAIASGLWSLRLSPWVAFTLGLFLGFMSLEVARLEQPGIVWRGLIRPAALIALVVLGGLRGGARTAAAAALGGVAAAVAGVALGAVYSGEVYLLRGPLVIGVAPGTWAEVLNRALLFAYVPLAGGPKIVRLSLDERPPLTAVA